MTNTYPCPKGHNSIDSDYCSDCGAKISGSVSPANSSALDGPNSSSHRGPERCPACGAAREVDGLAFCEICGWSFANGPAPAQAPIILPPPASAEPDPVAPDLAYPAPDATLNPVPTPAPSPSQTLGWAVILSIDPALRSAASPEPPAGAAPLTIPLTQPVSLIGRKSEARAIFPEISLAPDDAVSHRHALLQIDPAGALLLRDIGAANGTILNGAEIETMRDYPLHDGDQITLGHWSRITVQATVQAIQ